MCCSNCCTRSDEIKVGDRVHEAVAVSHRVRLNGALTIKVEYLSDDAAVVSIADRGESGQFRMEKPMSREDFNNTYSICRCDPNENCVVD